jgi:hypothetical protein
VEIEEEKNLPNLLLLRAFCDEHKCCKQVLEVDAFVGATAREKQPIGDV